MAESIFMKEEEVARVLEVSKSYAYRLIRTAFLLFVMITCHRFSPNVFGVVTNNHYLSFNRADEST